MCGFAYFRLDLKLGCWGSYPRILQWFGLGGTLKPNSMGRYTFRYPRVLQDPSLALGTSIKAWSWINPTFPNAPMHLSKGRNHPAALVFQNISQILNPSARLGSLVSKDLLSLEWPCLGGAEAQD